MTRIIIINIIITKALHAKYCYRQSNVPYLHTQQAKELHLDKPLGLHVAPQGSRTREVLSRISPTCWTKRKNCFTLLAVLGESSRKEKLVTLSLSGKTAVQGKRETLPGVWCCEQRPTLGWSTYSVHHRSGCRTAT
jgi:hypothetical protein